MDTIIWVGHDRHVRRVVTARCARVAGRQLRRVYAREQQRARGHPQRIQDLAGDIRLEWHSLDLRDDVAEDLLSVTDKRAENTTHTTAKKMYLKMRDGAKKNVIEAIPDLARLVEKHIGSAPQPSATA
jgi:hypothetical protein